MLITLYCMHKTTGEVWTDSQKLGMWVATACPWSSKQVSLNAYTRMKSTHVASMREELGYWILVPWDSTIEYRCLLCAPSSCVATPPASDSKSGWRGSSSSHWRRCVCVCLCVCLGSVVIGAWSQWSTGWIPLHCIHTILQLNNYHNSYHLSTCPQ